MADGPEVPEPAPSDIKAMSTTDLTEVKSQDQRVTYSVTRLQEIRESMTEAQLTQLPLPGADKFDIYDHRWSKNTQTICGDNIEEETGKTRCRDVFDKNVRTRERGGFRGRGNSAGQRHESGWVISSSSTLRVDRNSFKRTDFSSQDHFVKLHQEKTSDLNQAEQELNKILKNTNILLSVYTNKEILTKLIKSKLYSIRDADVIVKIVKIVSLVSETLYVHTKKKLILQMDVYNSGFIDVLGEYLIDLPTLKKEENLVYFSNQDEFWENFFNFCECLFDVSPSFAPKLRMLLEATVRRSLQLLDEEQGYTLSDLAKLHMDNLCAKLRRDRDIRAQEMTEDGATPENFRELSVLPRRSELISSKPFLRPNIVQGGYTSIEHYLDVQFRLLREDCYGPLRDGIFQYMHEPSKNKYDNIRVYHNVRFLGSYISSSRVGYTIQLDRAMNKYLKRINWAHSKRFIFGSLLLLTKDNCQSLIVATVLDREIDLLEKGQIPITLTIEDDEKLDIEASYTMIESEVYFEPYFHVLNALKDPKFPKNLAMSKYIVNVDPDPTPPAYLKENTKFTVAKNLNLQDLIELKGIPYLEELNESDEINEFDEIVELYELGLNKTDLLGNVIKFTVLNDETWPSFEYLGLNESQYRAYHLALTREFAVIQGPPGTGKTFLGVKVAQTLLYKLRYSIGTKLLVICYTNHALDQFLEALLPVTRSIVRVGGQSKSEDLDEYNLNKLRRNYRSNSDIFYLFNYQKRSLNQSLLAIKIEYEKINRLENSILGLETIAKYVPDAKKIGYGKDNENPLQSWLVQNLPISDPSTIVTRYSNSNEDNHVDDDIYKREVKLNEFLHEDDYKNYTEIDKSISVSFFLHKVEDQLKSKISDYLRQTKIYKDNKPYSMCLLETEMINLDSQIQLFKNMSKLRKEAPKYNISDVKHVETIPLEERWKMYFSWLEIVIDDFRAKIKPLEKPLEFEKILFEEARMMMDLEIIKDKKVIGMTTTGAARLRTLLQEIAARIVIVEEAAEVLEAHIVTSLTKHCKHLILIGDHQQLRPSAAHARLARHYNIEVSLFERMILNSVHSCQLSVQHRMRPEIAALITPHIYQTLDNHPSVELFPDVRGMTTNLFFFTHDHQEENVEDSASRSNYGEADLVLSLANYLMQQSYAPEDVTILAAYSGQMFYLRNQRRYYNKLSKVKITVVDNYQGEESKIVLLSLVRNNQLKKIGFLGTKNRVCVALSRAREGFYIFGNKDILKENSDLWSNILKTLEEKENVGTAFKLKCERHPYKITEVSTVNDFDKVPEGGCTINCDKVLEKCGHQCPLMCHGYDEEHTTIECIQKCERLICRLDHPCPLRCKDECQPCNVLVTRKLRCGHEQDAPCHILPHLVKCMTTVTVVLALCEHEVQKPCYMPDNQVQCPFPCEVRVAACGHACARTCHRNKDPDHLEYVCEKPCARAKANCSLVTEGDRGEHQCPKKCHEPCYICKEPILKKRSTCKHSATVSCSLDLDSTPCQENCARSLPCGHFCKKKCYEKCGDCKTMVTKDLPDCTHKMKIECSLEPKAAMCEGNCERMLPCGHACVARCGEPCGTRPCTAPASQPYRAPCGHQVYLPCSLYENIQKGEAKASASLPECTAACGAVLACGHACGGSCSRCRRAALHVPCNQRCEKTHLCGHRCREPCSALCPPCNARCEVRCPHSRCAGRCGAPCTPCKERCKRGCLHGSCARRCDEPCSRDACAAPCMRELPCGHACAGLCGEPCPPVCRQCDPDNVPRDFLGDAYDEHARFIQLTDCGHVVEAEDLQAWVQAKLDDKEVTLPPCPLCRTPILNTPRYRDVVNALFRRYINPVKTKLYGTRDVILQRRKDVKLKIADLLKLNNSIGNKKWTAAYKKILTSNMKLNKMSLLEVDMLLASLDILDILGVYHEEYLNNKLTDYKSELHEYISIICEVVEHNCMKLSEQQQLDIQNEIRRVHCVIQLAKIFHINFLNENNPEVEAAETAKSLVFTIGRFDEKITMDAMEQLQQVMKMVNVITKREREMLVRAMGNKAGHWYKCPNDHVYYIGECGGATQIGRCNECGAQVGGTNHRLLADNLHAGEMDGSKHAAWSDAANMNNYDLR